MSKKAWLLPCSFQKTNNHIFPPPAENTAEFFSRVQREIPSHSEGRGLPPLHAYSKPPSVFCLRQNPPSPEGEDLYKNAARVGGDFYFIGKNLFFLPSYFVGEGVDALYGIEQIRDRLLFIYRVDEVGNVFAHIDLGVPRFVF